MKRGLKPISFAFGAVFALALSVGASTAFAQCAMCKAAAAASGNSAAGTLNAAILVLLIPPVVIFCAIFIVAYRLREAEGDGQRETRKQKRARRGWTQRPEAGSEMADQEENIVLKLDKQSIRGRACPVCGGKIIPSDRAVYQSMGDPGDVIALWQCERGWFCRRRSAPPDRTFRRP